MNASQIIHEISSLSPDEQAKVVRFAYALDAERRLSSAELSALASRLANRMAGHDRLTLFGGGVS